VIGCQRSGTSLVRRILDSHSRIACPPESRFLLPLTEILRREGYLRGLASMGYGRAEVASSLAAFAGALFGQYAAAQGKVRWADKTPQYVECLDGLWEMFGPEARFILIVRHGLDVAYSLSDANRHYPAIDGDVERAGGNVPVGSARFWARQNETIEAFRTARPDACIRIRYEDVTSDPEGTLRPVFEFVGEEWEPSVLDYDRVPHHAGLEDPDVRRRRTIEPNSGRYLSWPPEVRRTVRAACEPTLSMLGYR
jgi:hypothetical protein